MQATPNDDPLKGPKALGTIHLIYRQNVSTI